MEIGNFLKKMKKIIKDMKILKKPPLTQEGMKDYISAIPDFYYQ